MPSRRRRLWKLSRNLRRSICRARADTIGGAHTTRQRRIPVFENALTGTSAGRKATWLNWGGWRQLRSLAIALAECGKTHGWEALAWEANARVAMAELDVPARAGFDRPRPLSAMEGFEVPLGGQARSCHRLRTPQLS